MNNAYASLWSRILAFSFDYIVLAAYITILVGVGSAARFAFPDVSALLFSNPLSGQLIGFLLITLPVTLYFALQESSEKQSTWGKRKKRLRVLRSNGNTLSKTRALGRTLLKFIPWELAHTCIWWVNQAGEDTEPIFLGGFVLVWVLVGANIVSLLLTRTRQTLYDLLADSVVVTSSVRSQNA